MQAKKIGKSPGKWAERALVASIHWDALRNEPRAYLTAAWWFLCRKKLRAYNQFASLFGRTSNAYRLWVIRQKAVSSEPPADNNLPPIIALIDAGDSSTSIGDLIRHLAAEGVKTLTIGTPNVPTLVAAAHQIDWKAEPWLLPLSATDRLTRGICATYRQAMAGNHTGTRLIYADDDLLDRKGWGYLPHFKPDWNAELFRHFDYLSGTCILKATRNDLESCSAEPDWIGQLTKRIAENGTPFHVPHMLHHRQARPQPQIPATPQIQDRELPPVSIIVPTRNRVDLLRTCLEGISATHYPNLEVIVVDNDSNDLETLAFLEALDPTRHKVLRQHGAFNFSEINNRAANEAQGQLLCLLNNDIEVIEPDWLRIMAVQAQRANIGAVGARLLYPDGRIQHAGVTIGMGNAAGHAHRFLRPENEGYFLRHSLPQFTMAVTAACLVVARDKFMAVGGLNERDFPVAFNDVDLCLKLDQRGWQSFYEPRATLIHHESVSRGLDRDPVGAARFARELAALQRIWRTDAVTDPFHHPQLSRASEQFVMQLQKEWPK